MTKRNDDHIGKIPPSRSRETEASLIRPDAQVTTAANEFLRGSLDVVRSLYPLVMSGYGSADLRIVSKADGSPVTATDEHVEREVAAALAQIFPGLPIVGEEAMSEFAKRPGLRTVDLFMAAANAEYSLVVDPIDGTKNYIAGNPDFAVAIALMKKTENGLWPAAAVVAYPAIDELYWCDADGAFVEPCSRADIPAQPLTRTVAPTATVCATGTERRWLVRDGIAAPETSETSGSSVVDIMRTALGRHRAVHLGAQRIWDVAAPLAIAERLGCALLRHPSGEAVNEFKLEDFSENTAARPWGLIGHFVLS